jgi:hypothetical protein
VQVAPHVQRLARLLHNRVVRRVLHAHPTATTLLVVGDLSNGSGLLRPTAVWDGDGNVLADDAVLDPGELGRWRALLDDLAPDFALLGRVSPVELFVPYVLDLSQLDLRLESDADVDTRSADGRPWY